KEMRRTANRGRKLLTELNQIGVLVYDSPLRGIALFPFFVHHDDGHSSTQREAFFVFKDSRESIDTFIFNDEFCRHADLYGWEREIPDHWKKPGATATL